MLRELDTIKKSIQSQADTKIWCLIKLVIFSIIIDLKELVFVEAEEEKNVMKVNSELRFDLLIKLNCVPINLSLCNVV